MSLIAGLATSEFIQRDDEGEPVAMITANILAPRHLSEHQQSNGIISTVDISTPAPDALRLAIFILRAAKSAGLPLPSEAASV
jgi:hypothetical protein